MADACADLLAATADAWPERLAAVHASGPAQAERLCELLRRDAAQPGAAAAVALLGRLGGDVAQGFLAELVSERSPLATEAALSLGQLRALDHAALLRGCVADRFADATLRTAAACALVRCGERAAVRDFLYAVMLAGSPAGAERSREFGLPTKTRWALERYMLQRLLQQEGAPELALQLDPDAPWPALFRAAVAIRDFLGDG